jgi:MbtH protein
METDSADALSVFDDESGAFYALINHEAQYSLWPVALDIPNGWQSAFSGSREDCLAYIDRVWVDMRPLSARSVDPED